MERYRRRRGEHIRKEDRDFLKIKIIRQTIVCVLIFAAVFGIGLLKTDTAVNISNNIKKSISYTVDYRSAVEEIVSKITNFTRGQTDEINQKADSTD